MGPHYEFKAKDIIAEGRTTKELIEDIRKWLKTTTHPNLSDEQIVLFLLSCNNVIEETQKTINLFYASRSDAPEFFDNRDMETPEMKHIANTVDLLVMPKRTKDGKVIVLNRLKNSNYWNYNHADAVKALFMSMELMFIKNPPTGLIFIVDMRMSSLMHLTRLKLAISRKSIHYVQDALPCQLKEIHIFNCPYFFDKVMYLLKPFMKKELLELLNLHPPNMDFEKFYENYLSKDCMPADYGGYLPDSEEIHQNVVNDLIKYKPFFDAEELQRKQNKKYIINK